MNVPQTKEEMIAEDNRLAHILKCGIARIDARPIVRMTDEALAKAIATYDKPGLPARQQALVAGVKAELAYRKEQ